jgi:hypothetical protein
MLEAGRNPSDRRLKLARYYDPLSLCAPVYGPILVATARGAHSARDHRTNVLYVFRQFILEIDAALVGFLLGIGHKTRNRTCDAQYSNPKPDGCASRSMRRKIVDHDDILAFERDTVGRRLGICFRSLNHHCARGLHSVFQCPCGTRPIRRSPRGQRLLNRTVLVLAAVSSTNTSRAGSNMPVLATQWAEYIGRENEVLKEQDNLDGYAPWDDHVINCPYATSIPELNVLPHLVAGTCYG